MNKFFLAAAYSKGPTTLNNGVVYACNFDGDSTDSAGTRDGTDTNVDYGISYGLIDRGAYFNTPTSKTVFSDLSLSTNWTISIWINPESPASPYGRILSSSALGVGIIYPVGTNQIDFYQGGTDFVSSLALDPDTWNHIVLRCSSGVCSFRINNQNDTGATGIGASSWSCYAWGGGLSDFNIGSFLDCACIWDRALTDQECDELYNSGNGLQYPF